MHASLPLARPCITPPHLNARPICQLLGVLLPQGLQVQPQPCRRIRRNKPISS